MGKNKVAMVVWDVAVSPSRRSQILRETPWQDEKRMSSHLGEISFFDMAVGAGDF
jgi:hypothetical protein